MVSSSFRLWRGTIGRKNSKPPELPILFDRENDEYCRLVREAFTELNLDAMVYQFQKVEVAMLRASKGCRVDWIYRFCMIPTQGKNVRVPRLSLIIYSPAMARKDVQSSSLRPGRVNLVYPDWQERCVDSVDTQ